MNTRKTLTVVFLTGMLCSMMAVEAFALDILAVKTCSGTITKFGAAAFWQETWCTGPDDLMNVTGPALAGDALQICMTARQSDPLVSAKSRFFGVSILSSVGAEVQFFHLAGVSNSLTGDAGMGDFQGSGCFLWSVPANDTYTFRLMTWQGTAGDLIWYTDRQVVVYHLP